jgi:hypothetical protein
VRIARKRFLAPILPIRVSFVFLSGKPTSKTGMNF